MKSNFFEMLFCILHKGYSHHMCMVSTHFIRIVYPADNKTKYEDYSLLHALEHMMSYNKIWVLTYFYEVYRNV